MLFAHNKPIIQFYQSLHMSQGESRSWDFQFHRNVFDHEIPLLSSFIQRASSMRIREGWEDARSWILDKIGFLSCKSFFKSSLIIQTFLFFLAEKKTELGKMGLVQSSCGYHPIVAHCQCPLPKSPL